MREAYRTHKYILRKLVGEYLLIGYIYIGPAEPCDFQTIQQGVIESLRYLSQLFPQDDHDSLPA